MPGNAGFTPGRPGTAGWGAGTAGKPGTTPGTAGCGVGKPGIAGTPACTETLTTAKPKNAADTVFIMFKNSMLRTIAKGLENNFSLPSAHL
jgi:hypothetical protein